MPGLPHGVLELKMDESQLDEDLKALSKRPRPNLPTDFKSAVWSKVQSREASGCQAGELA